MKRGCLKYLLTTSQWIEHVEHDNGKYDTDFEWNAKILADVYMSTTSYQQAFDMVLADVKLRVQAALRKLKFWIFTNEAGAFEYTTMYEHLHGTLSNHISATDRLSVFIDDIVDQEWEHFREALVRTDNPYSYVEMSIRPVVYGPFKNTYEACIATMLCCKMLGIPKDVVKHVICPFIWSTRMDSAWDFKRPKTKRQKIYA